MLKFFRCQLNVFFYIAITLVSVSLILFLMVGLNNTDNSEFGGNQQESFDKELCFLTAVSSNHLQGANKLLQSIQKFHPCAKTYIYNLGLKRHEKRLLKALPYVQDVMDLSLPVRGKDFFPSGSCAFKPPMILQFIDMYRNNETNCRFFFYGDSVIYLHHKFNRKALDEVVRLGLVAQAPRGADQIAMTHPGMFPFFGFDREWLFYNQHKPGGPGVMRQTQAGLMLVDAANSTMRRTFFQEWADCAANDDCLIPDKIKIDKRAEGLVALYNISGHRVFRAHRDDQSAFTFLISKYFGYGGHTRQKVYLDKYVGAHWRQAGSHLDLIIAGENCSYPSLNSSVTSFPANSSRRSVHNSVQLVPSSDTPLTKR